MSAVLQNENPGIKFKYQNDYILFFYFFFLFEWVRLMVGEHKYPDCTQKSGG